MSTLRVFSALLTYPTVELKGAVAELRQALQVENLIPETAKHALEPLYCELENQDLLDLEESYVLLFDRTRSLSLHLFEHVHGESRDRGQAMVDLRQQYRQVGLRINSNELPDYIPMFLEYLSFLPVLEARQQLAMCGHILAALQARLEKQNSPYAAVFNALVLLANDKPNVAELSSLLSQDVDDPKNMEKIDELWEEQAVSFRPDSQTCSTGINPESPKVQFDANSRRMRME